MTLWLLMTMLCSAVAVAISVPLIRRLDRAPTGQDAAIYQDQMKEVDRDLDAGTIHAPEAESAKAEIQRRLASAAKTETAVRPISNMWRNVALVASSGLVILGGVNLYGVLGSPDMPATSVVTPAVPVAAATAAPQQQPAAQQAAQQQTAVPAQNNSGGALQVDAMVAKLQAKLQANPKDAEGWRMLGWAQFNTQHYTESVEAYGKAIAIDPNNIDYKSAYSEALVQAAQGVVTPKAQEIIAEVLAKSPKDLRGRFYDALGHEQSGDQNGALDRWTALLADAPPDAGWRDDVKQRVTDLGKALGKDVSAVVSGAAAPVAAAQQKPLAAGEKDAMVAGMIAKLSAKLEANPKDRDGWAMMIRSLAVTGDKKGAEDALNKALEIFKGDQGTIDGMKQVAQAAGIGAGAGAAATTAPAAPAQGQASAIPPSAAAPQISADQQAAVQAMAPADQQTMIKGMVQKLADKMKDNPKDLDGWMRLMRAYQVLKEPDNAKTALNSALSAFVTEPDSIAKLKAAAAELGIN